MTVDIAEGRRLLAAATPGPWYAPDAYGDVRANPGPDSFMVADCRTENYERDALLIAWLRNNAEALLAGAAPDLDVERLARALEAAADVYGWSKANSREWSATVAVEYAALSGSEPS